MIPQEEHPDINFVGLLIGPRGNTLKSKHIFKFSSKKSKNLKKLFFLQIWKKKLEPKS